MASPKSPAAQPVESSSPAGIGAQEQTEKDDQQSVAHESGSSRSPTSSPQPSTSNRDSEQTDGQEAESPGEQAHATDDVAASTAPPLPSEPVPEPEDDGWEYHWVPASSNYWFYNRITGAWQQENPRVPTAADTGVTAAPQLSTTAQPPLPPSGAPSSVAGGYNPAIHGDYDPTAWYAQGTEEPANDGSASAAADPSALLALASGGFFNRRTGQWQAEDQGTERHSDEAKSRRQMNAFFDVDAAANAHDGRSLKAERANKKPSKSELKAFKERRRAKKEEKRRAWLRD